MSDNKNLSNKILEWLSKEGYPLEFKTATIFRKRKFSTFQGKYIADFKTDAPREIDVIADINKDTDEGFLRISYIIECKWTADKPWVVFTDHNSRISSAACVSQAITSKSAEAIFWCLASEKKIHELSIFNTPSSPGFNGRQAFSAHNDLLYTSLQSVTSACFSYRKFYDSYHKEPQDFLSFAVAIFPIVVINGKLFEASYNNSSDEIEISETGHVRLHWRGSEAWRLHSTIDVVTIEHLPKFVDTLFTDSKVLINEMEKALNIVKECILNKTLVPLSNLADTSRGVLGLPSLLKHLAI